MQHKESQSDKFVAKTRCLYKVRTNKKIFSVFVESTSSFQYHRIIRITKFQMISDSKEKNFAKEKFNTSVIR